MMRSPYSRYATPDYYTAAEVQRMADQLKHAALVWQQRYEQSQAAAARLQHDLNRARRAQASQDDDLAQQLAAMQTETDQLRAEADEWRAKYEAAQAELEAAPAPEPQPEVVTPEGDIEQFVVDVLPFIDNLERALKHANDNPANAPLREGIALTLKSFANTLANYGIQPIPAEGESFDPTVHEAMGVMPDSALPEGTVAEVEQGGYRHGARLLRPARVMVAG